MDSGNHKVILANGVFDAFHPGHLAHLQAAKELGGRLVVAVTKDKFVGKGPNRPIFNQKDRLAMVKALRCVDQAMLVDDSYEALRKVKPDIFVKGIEYRHFLLEKEYCLKKRIQVIFLSPRPEIRTSLLGAR